MSRPTVSASSIGPSGMPKSRAAASISAGAMPSSSMRMASSRYGMSTRLTRNPGRLATSSGRRSSATANARARASAAAPVRLPCTISMSCIFATGLKKCRPTRRDGSESAVARSSSGILEVLVASSACGFIFCSISRNNACLAPRSSTIASITRSARLRPLPARSGISRSIASCTARGARCRFLKNSCARLSARASASG